MVLNFTRGEEKADPKYRKGDHLKGKFGNFTSLRGLI